MKRLRGKNIVSSVGRRVVHRYAPRLVVEADRMRAMQEQLTSVERKLEAVEQGSRQLQERLAVNDTRLDRLKTLAAQVEPYQPAYGVAGIFAEEPRRSSQDRCRVIEKYLGDVRGLRILDVGSSIGYLCYYFADRGALCEGWESNVTNAEVSRLVGDVNGIAVAIKAKELNDETVAFIERYEFDVVTVLSVFHHVVRFNGLEYTQELVKELFDKIPVMIVELALKGEDPSLPWDASQPDDPLAIFDLVKEDVDIKKLGEFGTHLSETVRPLYVVSKKRQVKVNNHIYPYDRSSLEAYEGSPVPGWNIKRRYYFSKDVVVKSYGLSGASATENLGQILNEIQFFINVAPKHKIYNAPKMLDFEISESRASVVMERLEGELLSDLLDKRKVDPVRVIRELLKTLIDLGEVGLYHNDLRSWNVIIGKKISLIDYGLVGSVPNDNDIVALLWIADAIVTGKREPGSQAKANFPPREHIAGTGLEKLYDAVAKGQTSPASLISKL